MSKSPGTKKKYTDKVPKRLMERVKELERMSNEDIRKLLKKTEVK